MTPEYYSDIYRQYVTFMSDWTKSGGMCRIASGASSGDYNWTEVLMKNIPRRMLDGVALHHYSVIDWSAKGSATAFSEEQYFEIMERALQMEELISRHTNIMDKYDPEKRVDLVVDEWGGWYDVEPGTNPGFLYQQNTMRDAMIAGTTLNIFNNHSDRVKMANLAQTINVLQAVILTDEEKMVLTPTYHVMKMYNVHHDALRLPIHLKTDEYQYGDDVLPALSVSASIDKMGVMHISLVNIDAHQSKTLSVDVRGRNINAVTGQILKSGKMQDHNTFENPDRIKPQDFAAFKRMENVLEVTLPPFSVVVLRCP
jgi:alpha-N-arabinofuranosidase